jgi:hypothetical protein
MTARRHHYIPQCYLKGFAAPRKKGKAQLHVFDRERLVSFVAPTDKIAVERDFNRVEAEGVKPDALENRLSAFETKLAPALARTNVSGGFQNEGDRALILNLIGLLALRNPQWRERMRQFHEEVSRGIMDIALSSKEIWESEDKKAREAGHVTGEPISYEEMKAFHDGGEYAVEVSTHHHIHMEFAGLEAVLPCLFNRRWMFLRAPKNSGGFVTCDHPVNLMWSDSVDRRGPFNSPGFGLRNTLVLFPLSARLAIAGAFELNNDAMEVAEENIAELNGAMIVSAVRHVYARDLNFRYQLREAESSRKASRLVDDPHFRSEGNGAEKSAQL